MSFASSSSHPNPSPAPSEAEDPTQRSTSPLPVGEERTAVPTYVSSDPIQEESNLPGRRVVPPFWINGSGEVVSRSDLVAAYPADQPSATSRGARNRNRGPHRLTSPRSIRLRRRIRTTTRCLCLPVMVVTSMAAILLFVLLFGLPFLLFMAGLVIVYYCCTSNPIPFRTLLRAMVGVEDWQGAAFDGTTGGSTYSVTKEDIRKGTIRRLCLGPMMVVPGTPDTTEAVVGGDLSTLPRNHPGRVHWRNEGASETCLVFSAPLDNLKTTSDGAGEFLAEDSNEINTDASAMILRHESLRHGAPVEVNDADASEMMLRQESLRAKVPKYLQQCDDENMEEKGNVTEDDVEAGKDGEAQSVEEDSNCSLGKMPQLESAEEQPADEPADDPANDTDSSVRDRGTVCDICLLEFETGEAVAWSPNPACNHAYHEDCITDWLLRKPTCPSCRHDFIAVPAVLGQNDSSSASSGVSVFGDSESDLAPSANESRADGSINQTNPTGDVELGSVGTGP